MAGPGIRRPLSVRGIRNALGKVLGFDYGQGGELTWLLYDEFTTADAAPITSPRTCEPGPGTLTAFQPSDQLGIVGSKLTSADVAEYSGIVEPLIITDGTRFL